MSEALTAVDPGMLAILQGAAGGASLMPYVQDIRLLDCHVAGTSHVELEEVEPGLQPGDVLLLLREAQNSHDPLAILVLEARGNKLGYIPRASNEVLAHLMDAGKLLYAKIVDKQWVGTWLKIRVSVFLREW